MTSSEKLIRKEFKIKTEQDLYILIEKKSDKFFKDNFSTEKATYIKMIRALVNSINDDGASYSEYMQMARSGSMIAGAFTSSAVGSIKMQYQLNRKKLVSQVRFFI